MRSIKKLNKHLDYLENAIPRYSVKNDKVSQRTVGWQIDHSLKAINNVIAYLRTAPTDKKARINKYGRLFLSMNYIPRGKGKAPKMVLPPDQITEVDLTEQLDRAKENLRSLDTIDSRVTFKHHYFGILDYKQTIRFLEVHTNHHVKIIRDILK